MGSNRHESLAGVASSAERPHAAELETFVGLYKYAELLKTAPCANVAVCSQSANEWLLFEWSLALDSALGGWAIAELRSRLASSLYHLIGFVRAGDGPQLVHPSIGLNPGDEIELYLAAVVSSGLKPQRSIARDHDLRVSPDGFSCGLVLWIDSKECLLGKAQLSLIGELENGQPVSLRLEQVFGDYNGDIVVKEPEPSAWRGVVGTPDESAGVQGLQVYAYVSRLAESGATPVEIRQKLIEKGVDPQEATRLTDRLAASQAKKEIRARAISLLAQAVPPDQIQPGLVQEGFGQALVAEEVNALLVERARADTERREDPKRLWRLLGAVLVVAGVGLYIGNKTGAFPTFPYAGGILMGVGGLVSAMGWHRSA